MSSLSLSLSFLPFTPHTFCINITLPAPRKLAEQATERNVSNVLSLFPPPSSPVSDTCGFPSVLYACVSIFLECNPRKLSQSSSVSVCLFLLGNEAFFYINPSLLREHGHHLNRLQIEVSLRKAKRAQVYLIVIAFCLWQHTPEHKNT